MLKCSNMKHVTSCKDPCSDNVNIWNIWQICFKLQPWRNQLNYLNHGLVEKSDPSLVQKSIFCSIQRMYNNSDPTSWRFGIYCVWFHLAPGSFHPPNAFSRYRATARVRWSCSFPATTCTPRGRPSSPRPRGHWVTGSPRVLRMPAVREGIVQPL